MNNFYKNWSWYKILFQNWANWLTLSPRVTVSFYQSIVTILIKIFARKRNWYRLITIRLRIKLIELKHFNFKFLNKYTSQTLIDTFILSVATFNVSFSWSSYGIVDLLQLTSLDVVQKGTQIVRPDGRIVVIPPIERPTTRSRGKKKEVEKPAFK